MVQNASGEVLLGLRHANAEKADSELAGEGTWTFPGGKMDFGESIFTSAQRELKEETDLTLEEMNLVAINNNIKGDAHFVTLGFLVTKYSGTVKVMEKDEIVKWEWFSLSDLPQNLYFPTKRLVKNFKDNTIINLDEV